MSLTLKENLKRRSSKALIEGKSSNLDKLIKAKGWKFVYYKLKGSIKASKGWISDWEERPKGWSRPIRNWQKTLKRRSLSESENSYIDNEIREGNNQYIPYYLRRKLYYKPKDPISWAYHEKCFNSGLWRLRRNKRKIYWLKKLLESSNGDMFVKNYLKGKELQFEDSLSEKQDERVFKGKKELNASDIFKYIRRRSRITQRSKRKGRKSGYQDLKQMRKEESYLRRGIPKNKIGIFHINAGLKNTIISLTDLDKDVKAWSSNGSVGFKKKKRKSPYASFVTGQAIGQKAYDLGFRGVIIHLKGVGRGRHNSCRGLATSRLKILRIKDRIRLPHNGCRLRKKRRV